MGRPTNEEARAKKEAADRVEQLHKDLLRFDFTEEDLIKGLGDPMWRLNNLYKIVDKKKNVIVFRANLAQKQLIRDLHTRNVILKARKLGFSTMIQLLLLDTALFSPNERCVVIAQDLNTAESIFRDVIRFAYDNLPAALKSAAPTENDPSKSKIVFSNGSIIEVRTSARGSSPTMLHCSELGRIAAKDPGKAKEIVNGAIAAVPEDGLVFVESTAEAGEEGEFFNLVSTALRLQDSGKRLWKLEFKFHFFGWFQDPAYYAPEGSTPISPREHEYFDELESKIGKSISAEQRNWYVLTRDNTFSGDQQSMWQEFPSCVTGDSYVGTKNGLIRMADIRPDGEQILARYDKGIKPVVKIQTKLGYTVVCTNDHPILCHDDQYRKAHDLSSGDRIRISPITFGDEYQIVSYSSNKFSTTTILIDEEFALFLGIFMGDGSFNSDCVSIACCAEDEDTVQECTRLMTKFIGEPSIRYIGKNKGCAELRKGSTALKEPFNALGLLRQNGGLKYKRNIHVPEYIMRSPKTVVAAFLKGLFETDGFASRTGASVKVFSKYEHFMKDVQLLLLGFGIASRVTKQLKHSGNGIYQYEGFDTSLRAEEVRKFAVEIGFISKRKQDRANLSLSRRKTGSTVYFDWTDEIASIEDDGEANVFDITTATHNFSAGGIVVHNCPEEAFKVSMEGAYFSEQFRYLRKQERITDLPYDPAYPVSAFFDLGASDNTSVWMMQSKPSGIAVINYIEASGEPFNYFVSKMQDTGYVWDTIFLPHDANQRRQQGFVVTTAEEMFRNLAPNWNFYLIPKTPDKMLAIQQARNLMMLCSFDASNCKMGIRHLESYRKEFDQRTGTYRSQPRHGVESNAADAFLQAAQAQAGGLFGSVTMMLNSGSSGGDFGNGMGGWYQPVDLGY